MEKSTYFGRVILTTLARRMPMKKKIQIEYPLNPASGTILWGAISTPSGLQLWFADHVERSGKVFRFRWGKTETRDAELTNIRNDSFVRFHWTDEDDRSYFELKIYYNELTNDHLLEVTDFAEPCEEDDVRNLWHSQIDALRRICGV